MNVKTAILITAIALAFAINCKGQCLNINLIKNPNLEEYTCCPTNLSMINCADYWTQPLILSTSDYFNICAVDSIILPQILPLYSHMYFGNGYAGIICEAYSDPFIYREYIQGELSEPLKTGLCYYFQFWTLLSGYNSNVAIDALGIYFSDTLPKDEYDADPLYFESQINTNVIIYDTTNWTKISGSFLAQGGEKYFTVGTFKQEGEINKYKFKPEIGDNSYYFFDNFSLCPCDDTIPPEGPPNVVFIPNVFSPNGDGINDILYLRGEKVKELTFSVYNRWGEEVYKSTDISQGWDGRYKGKECADGVYFYTATVIFVNGEVENKKGNVSLIR
jgi:gliding motility-associated-like protein